jgi:hypothetical protein
MDITTPKLKKYGITRRSTKNCQCSQNAFVYLIPVKLDERVVKFIEHIGKPAFDFKKTSILKIENPTLIISGIRRLREIRLTLKKNVKGVIDIFEDAIIKYIESFKEKE